VQGRSLPKRLSFLSNPRLLLAIRLFFLYFLGITFSRASRHHVPVNHKNRGAQFIPAVNFLNIGSVLF